MIRRICFLRALEKKPFLWYALFWWKKPESAVICGLRGVCNECIIGGKVKKTVGNRKKEKGSSLQRSAIVMLVVLLFSFCFVFLVSSRMISNKSNEDYRRRTSETAVNNVISTIDAAIEKYNYISRLIMVNDNVVKFLKAPHADNNLTYEARMGIYEITNMYSNISYMDSVYIFRNDQSYANTGKVQYAIDLSVPEYERILKAEGKPVLSISGNGMIIQKDDKAFLTFCRAVYDLSTQKRIGMLIINISGDFINEVLGFHNTMNLCVVDNAGKLLRGNAELAALYRQEFDSSSMVSLKCGSDEQERFVMGSRAVEPLVVLCSNTESMYSLPLETTLALLLTLVTFVISAVVCAVFINTNITRPIINLNSAMEKTKSSGWLKRIDEELPDNEIGGLAENYNSMIDYLNELFNRLIEEEKNMRAAEISILHEQIKPHFLYNTLETINYLAVEEDAPRVHDALETLGSFYRNSLSKGDREITLGREIQIIRDYLSLQKLRYGDMISDEYDLEEETLGTMIPKLILQPLVENSIYHGVKPKGEPCVIRITSRTEADGLHILVYDSGVGMTEEQIRSVLEPGAKEADDTHGFGLHGTIHRIRYYCNDGAVIRIRSEIGEYTEVELCLGKEETREERERREHQLPEQKQK